MSTDNKKINLAELSDDEIMNLDPSELPEEEEEKEEHIDGDNKNKDNKDDKDESPKPGDDPDGDQSADDDDSGDDDSDDTDGADSEDDPPAGDDDGAGDTSGDESGGDGNDGDGSDESGKGSEDDQSSDDEPGKEEKDPTTDKTDYKAELAKVLAPFKAAKRNITVNTIADARRLMQMGVDYSRKMEAMKPYQRVLKTLERNNLLDIEKVNFLIDLDKKNPDAIRKFLKDSEIDPMDLDLKDDIDYRPNDHMVGDNELALDSVIDDIRGTDAFDRTVDVITNQWDTASRRILLDNPDVIRFINDHVDAGIYDMIADRLANERIFGQHKGLSDLEAYKAVGDAMHKEGKFEKPAPNGTSLNGDDSQDSQDLNGSDDSTEKDRKNRRKAASSTKGNATTGKKAPNFLAMTDEEIENFDINSL